MQKVISTDKAPSAIGPYSQAIEINGMVYTSGVIPVIPATGEIAEGGVEAQAEQAFKNLCNLVEESGSKVENIVKTTVFFKEINSSIFCFIFLFICVILAIYHKQMFEMEVLTTAKLNKIKQDTILKNFWKNNDRFADLFNAFYIWLVSRPSRF